ncbi:amylo-alpha-1,6-glucosidase [Desulfocurvibacter africanus]|uniref:amylo-alpha-1,6-glucosidase n=1 Tax=Desulfocurvibacter africanus TaxID=873 RepID=UPI002FDB8EEA
MAEVIQIGQQYYVLATAARADSSRRVLKHGDTFAVFDRYGDILPLGLGEEGVYHEGTRFVSRQELLIDGKRPLILSSNIQDDNSLFSADLTNPDLVEGRASMLARGTVHIMRSRFLYDGACHEAIRLSNFGEEEAEFYLSLILDADFVDMFEVRGIHRESRGRFLPLETSGDRLSLGYEGLDGLTRTVRSVFTVAPERFEGGEAIFPLRLAPKEQAHIGQTIVCESGTPKSSIPSFETAYRHVKASHRRICEEGCAVESDNDLFNNFLTRSLADLRMLMTSMDDAFYPYAGIPWFSTPFGRDGIITALESLWLNPGNARGVLTFLARTQAADFSAVQDAEPGKILHEARKGEMANTGEVPFGNYYGSIDSTPLFVMLAGEYLRRTGDLAYIQSLWPHVERALEWIDKHGDADGDGFVEYCKRSERGLRNQGWKDSEDSVFHEDGRLAEGSIALCEVQAYVYGAKNEAAYIAETSGRRAEAMRLRAEAYEMQRRFEATFWDEELGVYVLALDGEKRPCRVKSSNAGQCLLTGIASEERARRLESELLSQEFYSGWGVRTIASDQPRYNPMSYHDGSIWPHDNALIAYGLSRYGLRKGPVRMLEDMFRVGLYVDQQRLPELFCGFHRRSGEGPTLYPVACAPQAWASATPFHLLQACLGLNVDAVARTVTLDRPELPEFIGRIRMRNLRVGQARLDLVLTRQAGDVGAYLERREGDVTLRILK